MNEIAAHTPIQKTDILATKLPPELEGKFNLDRAWELDELVPRPKRRLLGLFGAPRSADPQPAEVPQAEFTSDHSRLKLLTRTEDKAKQGIKTIPVWLVEARGIPGGFGIVYEAWNRKLNELQAVKVMRDRSLSESRAKRQFFAPTIHELEAKTLARIEHPNIIHVYDFTLTDDGRPAIVMEWLDPQEYPTLKNLLEENQMEIADIHQVLTDMGAAIGYLSGRGIQHRDLKPGNIFLAKDKTNPRRTILGDFGLSNYAFKDLEGFIGGTPNYLSPERIMGTESGKITEASEVYSMATITYEMLTGKLLYQQEDKNDVLMAIVCGQFDIHEHPELLERIDREGWDKDAVAAVFEMALNQEEEFRYQTVAEFAEAFIEVTSMSNSNAVQYGIGRPR